MVAANVDIPALKARFPLGDTVEASGVRLRGMGRVRQGLCPFHDEAEGSFTVYADSERWYCFGCGLGGDVLDFIRRVEDLSLPEAIARLDGSPGLTPRSAHRPAGTRRPRSAALAPRDPALLTAAARFYAGGLRRHPEAREYLAARGIRLDAAARLGLGYAQGNGLRQALESAGFTEKRLSDSGLFMERGAERFAGMVVVPDASGGLVRWLAGRAVDQDRTPRFQALPGPKPVLGLGRLGPAPPLAVVAEGLFDWLTLAGWGLPACAALGTQGVERLADALRGCPRVFLAFDNDDAGRGRTCHASLRARPLPAPACTGRPRRQVAAPLPPTVRAPSLAPLHSPADSLSRESAPFTHHHPKTVPDSDLERTHAQRTTGFARTRLPVREPAPAHSLQEQHHKKENPHG